VAECSIGITSRPDGEWLANDEGGPRRILESLLDLSAAGHTVLFQHFPEAVVGSRKNPPPGDGDPAHPPWGRPGDSNLKVEHGLDGTTCSIIFELGSSGFAFPVPTRTTFSFSIWYPTYTENFMLALSHG